METNILIGTHKPKSNKKRIAIGATVSVTILVALGLTVVYATQSVDNSVPQPILSLNAVSDKELDAE